LLLAVAVVAGKATLTLVQAAVALVVMFRKMFTLPPDLTL
jgi:hypothetical protein